MKIFLPPNLPVIFCEIFLAMRAEKNLAFKNAVVILREEIFLPKQK